MSALDDLKNGNDIVIDAVNGEDNTNRQPNPAPVNNTVPSKPKTIVMPKNNSKVARVNSERHKVDIDAIAAQEAAANPMPERKEGDIEVQPGVTVSDILNSKEFNETVERKKAETKAGIEWEESQKAAQEEAKQVEELSNDSSEDDTDEIEDSDNDYAIDNSPSETNNENLKMVDVLDEEDIESSNSEDDAVENESAEIDDNVDEFTGDDILDKLDEDKESIDAPDIDIAMSTTTTGVDTDDEKKDEDNDEESDAKLDEDVKELRKQMTEKLKPINKLDISHFTVVKKASSSVDRLLADSSVNVVKWVLPSQGTVVLMKEFTGAELETLRENSEDSGNFTELSNKYRAIYDHIVSPKPQLFESWLKVTPVTDLDHLMFAIYVASFNGANYIDMNCENDECNNTFISDNIKIMDMVKFDKKEDRDAFTEIYKSEPTMSGKGLYITDICAVSDKVAIEFKEPSLYDILGLSTISESNYKKFSSIISYLPYIENIYAIDTANHSLSPIEYTTYNNSIPKTIISKLINYNKALKTLDPDKFALLNSYTRAIGDRTTSMHYVRPASVCPKCGKEIKEVADSAEALLFTRYQLGALVNMSIK